MSTKSCKFYRLGQLKRNIDSILFCHIRHFIIYGTNCVVGRQKMMQKILLDLDTKRESKKGKKIVHRENSGKSVEICINPSTIWSRHLKHTSVMKIHHLRLISNTSYMFMYTT